MANNAWNGEHTWSVGEPITQEKMNSIEGGIAEAQAKFSEITTLDARLDKIDGGQALTGTKTLKQQVTEAQNRADDAYSKANTAATSAQDGTQALAQIQATLERGTDSQGNQLSPYSNLATRLAADLNATNATLRSHSDAIAEANDSAAEAKQWINNAKVVGTVLKDGRQVPAESLAEKITDIDRKINNVTETASGLASTISPLNGLTYGERLTNLDANTIPTMNVPEIITEITGARGKNAQGGNNTALSQRFTQDETRIAAIDGNSTPSRTLPNVITELEAARDNKTDLNTRISAIDGPGSSNNKTHTYRISQLENEINTARNNEDNLSVRLSNMQNDIDGKVDQNDIKKGLTYSTDDNTVLQARQGFLLKEDIDTINNKIGGSYSSSSTVHSAITGLDSRLDAIDGGQTLTGTNLTTRVSNAESAINILNGNASTSGSVLNTVNTTVNNKIAELVDSAPTTLDTLGEIAAWIQNDTSGAAAMQQAISNNTSAISGLNTRLTAIDNSTDGRMKVAEGKISTLETTVGDNNSGLVKDINALNATVGDNTSGLIKDVNALNATVGDNTSGLVKDVATLKTTVGNSTSGLVKRVNDLENKPKSATVVIDNTHIIYTEGKPTNIGETPSTDKDYLLQGASPDTKYYYWKYIDNEWELISGGGSGSGNNNAQYYATEASFLAAEKDINKDYYVLKTDGVVHHYRYLSTDAVSPIEIGILTNQVKSYQVDNYYEIDNSGERTDYLDFYGFNFGTNVTTYNIDPDTDAQYRLARIQLPKGGGGGGDSTGYRIYSKVRGDDTRRISLAEANNGITLNYGYTCYSYSEEDGYAYKSVAYELTRGDGVVIASSNGQIVGHLTKDQYTNGDINISVSNINTWCIKNQTTEFTLRLYSPTDTTIRDKTLTVYITVVDLSLRSTFSDQQTYSVSNNLVIPYTFEGMEGEPTFIVLLDNNSITPTIAAGNITIRSSQLTGLSGVHNLSIKASQIVSGTTLYSNVLNYQLGLTDGTGTEIMLFSGAALEEKITKQYQLLKLPYYLYVPATLNDGVAAVSFEARRVTSNWQDMNPVQIVEELYHPTENLSTGSYEYDFRLHEIVADVEYYIITITCSDKQLIFKVKINRATEQINIKTEDLVFDFKPERYNNNTATVEERLWSYAGDGVTYRMRIPENAHFDWRTGGWIKTGEDEIPCFCVKAGSRVEFVQENNSTHAISPLTLFWSNMEQMGGSNFKCTFKIDNVKTPNTPFLTSLDTETNTIINYGKTILASKQDVEDDNTLLYNYLNIKYIHTETFNGNKSIKEAIETTVLGNEPFSTQLTQELCAAAESSAASKNIKKIKQYISNIYDIANQASNQEHRTYLLKVLAGKADNAEIDYSTIKNEITTYLQVLENAQAVYNRLVSEGTDNSTITYAYRQTEPINFDAMLNGFVVEGKAGKDGIIAMIQFTFVSEIRTGGTFSQTVSAQSISTNSFAKTGTFLVNVTDTRNNITKIYEVEMLDEAGDGTYTEIVSIKDASDKETRAYGLELNALGSNIYLPSGVVSYAHSEGDIIEFEYNVNPEISGRVNSSIIIYEDGVPSAAKLYTSRNNIFEQISPGCLTIGSDDCDVYIYKMRLYDKALNNADILANFYADGLTTDEMMDRYDRNKNLVNAETITPQLIAEECPDLRVIMIEAPNLTGGKTSFIKNTKVRCIYKNGRPEDNWVALNAYHAGQGTSSDNYGAAGRNLDIMFGFDGEDTVIVPKPQKNNYTFDPTYKSMLIKGLDEDTTNDILTAEEYAAAGYTVEQNGTGKVTLTSTSVPNNWFNIKVNIASSENTNNAFLQKRFDRYLKQIYKTPAQKRGDEEGIEIKNDMEFFNCVIFIKETGTPSEFTEDKDIPVADRPWHFYGIGNIGDSKKTDNTRVNIPGDPNEFAIEISDNGLLLSGFSTGVFYISEASKERNKPFEGYKINEINTELASLNADLLVAQQNSDIQSINRINTRIAELQTYIPEATALSATTAHICTSEEYTTSNDTYTFNIATPDSTTLYLVPVVSSITYYRRFMYISNRWTEINEPITFTRTSYGIKYPVSKAEWECNLNTYRNGLMDTDSGKGWDKSFEFRYDLTTKDGETVARNDTEAALNAQRQKANKLMFAKLYTWIATSSNKEFKDNLGDWFIQESPLYWYLFTERYTMIDSRAKNTFYHCGKVYITEAEAAGTNVDTLYAALQSAQQGDDQVAIENAQTAYNVAVFMRDNASCFLINNTLANEAHNYGYRFDYWDYDDDTALGINNNGQMVFSAGLEDIDKDVSGWIYNEAESVIWRRIRENMYDKLGALYVQLKGTCFNAENLIQEFDNMQSQFPEELWRLDFERKYYRPFISGGETTYLNDMANGRKKYQRRQFERNMAIYINSKYQRNGSYNENDIISFRPQFTWTAGRDTKIIIKPYSTMYINFALGNYDNTGDVTLDKTLSTRVNRGEALTINAGDYIEDFNNIQCIIYNASRIMELDGLGNFECKQFILGAAKKLTVLKLGSTEYPNRSMADINNMGLSDGLPLLEELDLTNIQFGTAPDTFALDNFPLLKKLNATGCNIRSFTFKDGGMLEQVIFPSVLTKIDFKNLYNLVDTLDENNNIVSAVTLTGAANLTSYYSENSYSNSYQIVRNMLNNAGVNGITKLILNDINWTIGNISELEQLEALQKKLGSNMYLKGTIIVTGTWSVIEKNHYAGTSNSVWPEVTINTDNGTLQQKYLVTFKYDSATVAADNIPEDQQTIFTYYITADDDNNGTLAYYDGTIWKGLDPVSLGWVNMPSRKQTDSHTYIFGSSPYTSFSGWTLNGSTPTMETTFSSNITLYTKFISQIRTYKFRWYSKNSMGEDILVYTSTDNIQYGNNSNNSAPTVMDMIKKNYPVVLTNNNNNIISIFKGWDHLPLNISPSTQDIHAVWHEYNLDTINFGQHINLSNLSAGELYKLCTSSYLANISTDDHMTIQLGYDGLETPTTTIEYNNSPIIELNAAENFYLPISTQRLFTQDQEFTLMIDYKFNITNSPTLSNVGYANATPHRQSILLSCYQDTNGAINGFKLYYDFYNGTSRISFGDDTVSNHVIVLTNQTNAHNRNILVLRHPANSENLYVSYGTDSDGIITDVNEQVLSIPVFTAFNAPLVIGACLNSSNMPINDLANRYMTYGNGTIYKLCIWNKDLGSGEAKALANWCHEKATFGVVQTTNTNSVLNIPNEKQGRYMPNLYLTTLATSEMSNYTIQSASSTEAGWLEDTTYRQMLHQRLVNALPIEFQSILHAITVRTNAGVYDTSGFSTFYSVNSNNAHELDNQYISVPSYIELAGSNSHYEGEALRKFPWTSATNTTVKTYNNGSFVDGTKNAKYFNVRGQGVAINNINPKIYQLSVNDINSDSSAYKIITAENTLNCGDMWDDNGVVYIYADQAAVNAGAPIIYATTQYNSKYACLLEETINNQTIFTSMGGWVPATEWWTRSYVDNENIYQGNPNFVSVAKDGSIVSTMSTASYYIDYSIGF